MKQYRAIWENGDTTPWWDSKRDVEVCMAGEFGDSFHGDEGVIETKHIPDPPKRQHDGEMSPQQVDEHLRDLNTEYLGSVI